MSEATTKFVAYYRVSTKRQGQSGLGLGRAKNSRHRVRHQERRRGGSAYTEIESGKR